MSLDLWTLDRSAGIREMRQLAWEMARSYLCLDPKLGTPTARRLLLGCIALRAGGRLPRGLTGGIVDEPSCAAIEMIKSRTCGYQPPTEISEALCRYYNSMKDQVFPAHFREKPAFISEISETCSPGDEVEFLAVRVKPTSAAIQHDDHPWRNLRLDVTFDVACSSVAEPDRAVNIEVPIPDCGALGCVDKWIDLWICLLQDPRMSKHDQRLFEIVEAAQRVLEEESDEGP